MHSDLIHDGTTHTDLTPAGTPPLLSTDGLHSFAFLATRLRNQPDWFWWEGVTNTAPSLLVNHPEMVKHVLVRNHKNYVKGSDFQRVKMLTGPGLIVLDGDIWKRHRQLVSPGFAKSRHVNFHGIIKRASLDLKDAWNGQARNGEHVDVTRAMSRFALDIILQILFSEDLPNLTAQFGGNPFDIFVNHAARDMQLARCIWQTRGHLRALVERRRSADTRPDDMLSILMDSSLSDGSRLTDSEIVDELITLIVAGHETSAITLAWMWMELARNPEIETRMRELLEVCPETEPDNRSDAGTFIAQVMYETLRLYPPVWLFSRQALHDDRILGIKVPAGTTVMLTPYYLHRRADLWPEPSAFRPERFAARLHHQTARGTDYIPFSAGPRRCIGENFSVLEAITLFATVMPQLKASLSPDFHLELEPAVNLRSRNPIMMQLEQV